MWDGGYCDPGFVGCDPGFVGYDPGFIGYDPGFIGYDYGPCYGPAFGVGFVAPIGGYYNQPYVVREEVVYRYPNQRQSQPQVVVVNNKGSKKGKKTEEVEYMMVDPTDREGKRLIKVDPQKVKEGAFVLDDKATPVASKSDILGGAILSNIPTFYQIIAPYFSQAISESGTQNVTASTQDA